MTSEPISKFLKGKDLIGPLMAAGLVDATLIVGCLIGLLVLTTLVMNALMSSGWHDPFNFRLIVLQYLAPLVAPLCYSLVSVFAKSDRSVGERCLSLTFTGRSRRILSRLNHFGAGIAGVIGVLLASNLASFIIQNCFEESCRQGKISVLLVQCNCFLLGYACSVAAFLALKNYASVSKLKSDPVGMSYTPLRTTLLMLSLPFALAQFAVWMLPHYFLYYSREALSVLILAPVFIWWTVGVLIVRYWNSPGAFCFYVGCLVVPGILWFDFLPILSCGISIHSYR